MSLWKLLAIKIQPDVIFHIGAFPISNTLLCTWISIVVLVVGFFFGTRHRNLIPSGMQNFMEWAHRIPVGNRAGGIGERKRQEVLSSGRYPVPFYLSLELAGCLPRGGHRWVDRYGRHWPSQQYSLALAFFPIIRRWQASCSLAISPISSFPGFARRRPTST